MSFLFLHECRSTIDIDFVSLNILIVVANLYCLVAGVVVKELHKLDFFLALLQCSVDFAFTGVFSLIFNFKWAHMYLDLGCFTFAAADEQNQLVKEYDFWETTQWQR